MIASLVLYYAISTVLCLGFCARKMGKLTVADLILSLMFGWAAWWVWAIAGFDSEGLGKVIWRRG